MASMASTRSITELAAVIATKTPILEEYFTSHGIPSPSFAVDALATVDIPEDEIEASDAHAQVAEASLELHNLMKGPIQMLLGIAAISFNDVLSLQAVHRFNVASRVPLDGEVSFDALSAMCGVNVTDLRRLLRHAMTNHIFQERNGMVSHTAASRVLVDNKLMRDIVGIMCEELFLGKARTIDALEKYNGAHDPEQSGFSLGHNTDKGFYDELRQFPIRNQRFFRATNDFAAPMPLEPLANGFDWNSFAEVVDIGGGWGPVSIGLAERFLRLKFVVQDFPEVIAAGLNRVPPNLISRIEFMPFNFLAEQTRKGADVYFFRAVFHCFPDEYCIKILRNQIPALKKGAHVVINDSVMSEPWSMAPHIEKWRRSMDLNMMTLFGSHERTDEEWRMVIKDADSRFQLRSMKIAPGGINHIMDIVWTG